MALTIDEENYIKTKYNNKQIENQIKQKQKKFKLFKLQKQTEIDEEEMRTNAEIQNLQSQIIN